MRGRFFYALTRDARPRTAAGEGPAVRNTVIVGAVAPCRKWRFMAELSPRQRGGGLLAEVSVEVYSATDALPSFGANALAYIDTPGAVPVVQESDVRAALKVLDADGWALTDITVRVLPKFVQTPYGEKLQSPFAHRDEPNTIHLPPWDIAGHAAQDKLAIETVWRGAAAVGPAHRAAMEAAIDRLADLNGVTHVAHVIAHEYSHLLTYEVESRLGKDGLRALCIREGYWDLAVLRGLEQIAATKYASQPDPLYYTLFEAIAEDNVATREGCLIPHGEFYRADVLKPQLAERGARLVRKVLATANIPESVRRAANPQRGRAEDMREAVERAYDPAFWAEQQRLLEEREAQFAKRPRK